MAKIIQLTENEFVALRAEFEQALKLIKVSDGKVNFTKQFSSFDRKALLYFTAEAHEKMQALVQGFDKEVAWHGVAERFDDDGKDGYLITDILVYPQTVTGASVDMDVDEYDKWIRDNAEDERMYRLRMQGHSHVNMGVTPSTTDLKHQSDILRMIPKTGFYIFIIINKRNDWNVKIYDLKKNVLFEEKDVSVHILPEEETGEPVVISGVSEKEERALREALRKMRSEERTKDFVAEAKKMVRDRAFDTAGKTTSSYSESWYNSQPKQPAKPAESKPQNSTANNTVKKKGKRKKSKASSAASVCRWEDDDEYGEDDRFWGYWRGYH